MKIVRYSNVSTRQNRAITAAHTCIRDADMKTMLSSDIFEFMNEAYKYIGGFRSFTGEDDFADRSYLWYITSKGPIDVNDLHVHDVYTVSVFKQKYGLKLVGVGNNRFSFIQDANERKRKKAEARSALSAQLRWATKVGWIEASGKLDRMIADILPTSAIIEPEDLLDIFPDIEIMPDGLSYARKLSTGMEVVKRAYGNIRL